MKIRTFYGIFAAIFAALIFAASPALADPAGAQATRTPRGAVSSIEETEIMWGYADFRSGDALVVIGAPNPEGIPPHVGLVMMDSIVADQYSRSATIDVDELYEDNCAAWKVREDGDTFFQAMCIDEDVYIIVVGSDEDDTLEAAYSTLDDREPSVPSRYKLIDKE